MGDVSKNPSHNSLTGHQGHLTLEQERIFANFKELLAGVKLYTPATDKTPASHDDATLLRFLRARQFDVGKAHKQFSESESWRKENDIDKLYADFDTEEFETAKRFFPRWTGRRDKNGMPLFVYRMADINVAALKEFQERQCIAPLWEFLTRFVTPLCCHLPHPAPETPIVSLTAIVDFAGCSMGTLWSLRSHLQQLTAMAMESYPETLNTITILNAPSYVFIILGWIKNWLDEGTRNKIQILGADHGPALRNIIDPQHLPKAYGGELEWHFHDDPCLDEDATKVIGKEVPKGPLLFVDGRMVRPERTDDY